MARAVTAAAPAAATDVVIGAGSGMGEAVARRLAASSPRLLLADLDVAAVERLAGELAAEAHRCDITDDADLRALADAAGPLRSLVVTAGLSPNMADGRKILSVNAVGTARALRAFDTIVGPATVAVVFASSAAHMIPADAGVDAVLDDPLADRFLDDLEGAGIPVDDPGFAYAVSKRGVMRQAQRAACAWADRGARVLSVSPGVIDTPMGRLEAANQPVMAQLVDESPIGRMITPDEVAAVVCFLLSDAAAAINGTDVLVDGGATAAFVTGRSD